MQINNHFGFDHTVKNEQIDFKDWHQGRSHYALWGIKIEQENWLEVIYRAHQHMSHFLIDNCFRQPHITLFTCGLFDDKTMNKDILAKQVQCLSQASISPFELMLGSANSFSTCPYLSLVTQGPQMSLLRALLTSVSVEDRSSAYIPHISLGLYKDRFTHHEIAKQLFQFDPQMAQPLKVNKLSYFTYRSDDICSELETHFQLDLLS